jgi:UDP-2-acetamido-2-deoxy-ribo-hexuluronate aminotransferase
MAGKVMSLPMGPYLSTANAQQVATVLLNAADVARRNSSDPVALPE